MSKIGRRGAVAKPLAAAQAAASGVIDQAAGTAPVVTDPPIPAADVVPAPPAGAAPDDAAVLLDPTLTGEPDAPQPIVSAAPVLAMEPSAIDVVQADARAERIEAGTEPGATGDAALDAVAAQPTIAIEGETGAAAAVRGAARSAGWDAVEGVGEAVFDIFGNDASSWLHRQEVDGVVILTLDEILFNVQLLADHDRDAFDVIRRRFFDEPEYRRPSSSDELRMAGRPGYVSVVAVTGPAQGRRRAGMSFGTQARLFLARDISEAAIAALRADPALAVSINEVDANEVDDMTFDVYPATAL